LTRPFEWRQIPLGLIVAGGVESDRHVIGLVPVDEEQEPEQDRLGIERGIGGAEGTDVCGGGGGGGGGLLHPNGVHDHPLGGSNSVCGPFPSSHVGRTLDEIFLLQIVNQPNVERKRGFGRASEIEKLVVD